MKPILFNTEQVRNILDGRKTNTRRPIKGLPECEFLELEIDPEVCFDGDMEDVKTMRGLWATFEASGDYYCPFPMRKSLYQVGDILYVRETWYYEQHMENITAGEPDLPSGRYKSRYVFRASTPDYPVDVGVGQHGWRPSIHMPREAARIFLKVTDVRVERLQDITEEGAIKEGFAGKDPFDYQLPIWYEKNTPNVEYEKAAFAGGWEQIYAKRGYSWKSNPWVWVYEFEWMKGEQG